MRKNRFKNGFYATAVATLNGEKILTRSMFYKGLRCVCVYDNIYLVYALAVFIYTFLLLVYMSHRLEGTFKSD